MIEALLEVRACVRTSQLSDSLRQYLYDKYVQRGREDRTAPACRETDRRSQSPTLPVQADASAVFITAPAPLRRRASSALGVLVLVGSMVAFLLVAWGGGAA